MAVRPAPVGCLAHVVIVFVIVKHLIHHINHSFSHPQVVDGTPSWLLTVFPSA